MQEDHKFEYSMGYLMILSPQKKNQYYTPMKIVPSSSITRKGHSTFNICSSQSPQICFNIPHHTSRKQLYSHSPKAEAGRKECKWLPRRVGIKRKPRAYPQFPRSRSVGTGLIKSTLVPQRLMALRSERPKKEKKKTPRQNAPELLPSAF